MVVRRAVVLIALMCGVLRVHAVEAKPPASSVVDMAGKSCLAAECHAPLVDQRYVHAPAAQGDCQVCHAAARQDAGGRSVQLHQFQTQPPQLTLCSRCHKELKSPERVVHEPFKTDCTQCHDPHGGQTRYFLAGGSAEQLCRRCHSAVTNDRKFLHAPVALNSCNACHTPHSSQFDGLLARPPDKLCIFCHIEFKLSMDRAVSVHQPASEACFGCHDPHGGQTRGFLPTSQTELCQKCHAELFDRMARVSYSHRAMIEGKNCSDCHNPHWSASARLLNKPSRELCLGCHSTEITSAGGRRLAAVGVQVSTRRYLHGPIRQGDCTPCHAAHGSDDPRLMKFKFPEGFYAPYSQGAYELCMGCHNPELIEKELSTATGFRNGEVNLHFKHVHQEKGRSCRACHHEHASDAPFHIRDRVSFGQWQLQIAYEKTDTGGVCHTGCHRERYYDREHPVQYTEGDSEGRP
ncbi:MAG: cytochrome c3 family protein [Candidatus Sumerlaeia bacterium]